MSPPGYRLKKKKSVSLLQACPAVLKERFLAKWLNLMKLKVAHGSKMHNGSKKHNTGCKAFVSKAPSVNTNCSSHQIKNVAPDIMYTGYATGASKRQNSRNIYKYAESSVDVVKTLPLAVPAVSGACNEIKNSNASREIKKNIFRRQKRTLQTLADDTCADTSMPATPAQVVQAKAKRRKSPPEITNPTSLPVSQTHWSLDQLKTGKLLVDSVKTLAQYLGCTPYEDSSPCSLPLSQARRCERRLRKVQLYELKETLEDFFHSAS